MARGEIQVEAGIRFHRDPDGASDLDQLIAPDLAIRLGVLPGLELALAADGLVYDVPAVGGNRASGSDLVIDARLRFWEPSGLRPAAAVQLDLSFPSGGRSVTSDGYDPGAQLLLEWPLGERAVVDANLGFSGPTQGVDDRRRIFEFAPKLSASVDLTPRGSAFAGYFGAIRSKAPDQHSVEGGFVWLANDDLAFDVSLARGFTRASTDWTVSAGFAWRFRYGGQR
jgi:hypothetical protein